MTLRLKIYINRSKVVDDTYNLGGGQNLFITTLSNVPEGSTYRIRFIVRDSLSGQKSKGGFKKKVDCIEEPVTTTTTIGPSNTTTTIPNTTTTIGPSSTTSTTIPITTTTTIPGECVQTLFRGFSLQSLSECIDAITGSTSTTTTTTTTIPTEPDPTEPDPTEPIGTPTTNEEDDFCE